MAQPNRQHPSGLLSELFNLAAVAPCPYCATEAWGLGCVDHQNQDALSTLDRMGNLEVQDTDTGVGGNGGDFGQDAVAVGHCDAQLGEAHGERLRPSCATRQNRGGTHSPPA